MEDLANILVSKARLRLGDVGLEAIRRSYLDVNGQKRWALYHSEVPEAKGTSRWTLEDGYLVHIGPAIREYRRYRNPNWKPKKRTWFPWEAAKNINDEWVPVSNRYPGARAVFVDV